METWVVSILTVLVPVRFSGAGFNGRQLSSRLAFLSAPRNSPTMNAGLDFESR